MGMATQVTPEPPGARQLLRHMVATHCLSRWESDARRSGELRRFSPGREPAVRPAQILAHIGDLMEWSLRLVQGEPLRTAWRPQAFRSWEEDVTRFHDALKALDDFLQTDQPLAASYEVLVQGPVADA